MGKYKKFVSCFAAVAMCMGFSASAQFTDMPEGDLGSALQNAVNAGLIQGVSETSIAPYDNITRAQMAAIIVRAFNAQQKSDKAFNDVASDAWYAEAVSKAAAMGAFAGDQDGNFNPQNNITFQETYIVLSRVFGFEPYKIEYSSGEEKLQGDCEAGVLDKFSDKSLIAPWAVNGAKYVVGNGGWSGIDGKLKPTEYITRGEFAVLMDSLVETYIDEPGTYKNLPDGLTMVRCGGVTIDGLKTDSNLVITYGVDEKGCKVINSAVSGVTLVLGGIDKTPVEKATANESGTVMEVLPDESYVYLQGEFHDVRVQTPFVYLDASAATVEYYRGASNTLASL